MDSYRLITPAAAEPISLAEAKLHLRVEEDFEDDDTLISSLITAARKYTEDISSSIFLPQTWRLTLDAFPCRNYEEITLRKRPVSEVVSIKYIDQEGVQQTLDPALYQVDNSGFLARIRPAYNQFWPYARCQLNAVEVTFVAGYGDGSDYDVTIVPDAGWVTTATVSAKTKSGFTVTFGTGAPIGGSTFTYAVSEGDPAIELIAATEVAVDAAGTSATITFAQSFEGIPEYLKSALLLLIGHYYENREDVMIGVQPATLPRGYDALIGVERAMRV